MHCYSLPGPDFVLYANVRRITPFRCFTGKDHAPSVTIVNLLFCEVENIAYTGINATFVQKSFLMNTN